MVRYSDPYCNLFEKKNCRHVKEYVQGKVVEHKFRIFLIIYKTEILSTSENWTRQVFRS
jgi:hypothetical protein